ncbi:MAG: hypothetical protein Q8R57_05040 [Bacteroidota bacterium]|nr:hypothetical protein [Bacteroidota bacterium]
MRKFKLNPEYNKYAVISFICLLTSILLIVSWFVVFFGDAWGHALGGGAGGARIISIVETLLGVLAFIFFLISLISSFIGLASFENNPKLKGRGYGYASLVILGLIVLLFLLSF